MAEPWIADYAIPIFGAIAAGGLIGLEREYRGHAAGLRTHILVALASALLMLAAGQQARWLGDVPLSAVSIDPVRMAHGILTGIGFLCGGVIFRSGLSVHGLTTAASLWITSALGVLFGVGLFWLATTGTLATLVILVVLRIGAALLPQHHHLEIVIRYRRDVRPDEAEIRALAKQYGQRPDDIGFRLLAGGEAVEVVTTLRGPERGVAAALSDALCADPRVLSFDLIPRNI